MQTPHLSRRPSLTAFGRRSRAIALGVALTASISLPALAADPLIFQAASTGQQTLDEGEGGGNPFASALIELLSRPSLALRDLAPDIRELTRAKSRGFQSAEVPEPAPQSPWLVVPAASGERRVALVIVVSEYDRSTGAPSLPGARRDAERIAAALKRSGFAVELALDLDAAAMLARLKDFAARSAEADAAVIYSTGHGVEVEGQVYLLPGDYPVAERKQALRTRALRLTEIASAARAKVSLVFWGGWRDNPFGE